MTGGNRFYLGCPVWQSAGWNGVFLPSGTAKPDMLAPYAETFDTVEGNSTFYALPAESVMRRWLDQTPPRFRFCFKVPRIISHEKSLRDCDVDFEMFFRTLTPVFEAGRMGPCFLQLPPTTGGVILPALERFLSYWPADWPLAVEPRHRDFFDEGRHERAFDTLLERHGTHRVILDSRPLFSRPPNTESETRSQSRKPKSPLRQTVIAGTAFVRLIGRDTLAEVEPFLDDWAVAVAEWLDRGVTVYFFTHTPDDAFGPITARRFHEFVMRHRPSVGPPRPWPIERGTAEQGLLF